MTFDNISNNCNGWCFYSQCYQLVFKSDVSFPMGFFISRTINKSRMSTECYSLRQLWIHLSSPSKLKFNVDPVKFKFTWLFQILLHWTVLAYNAVPPSLF